MTQLKLTIDKVGPHRSLELVFDTSPGTINVIHGGNAGGKTKTLEVLGRMSGDGSTVEVTDGFAKGQATLADDANAFTLKVGKKTTPEGTLPVWIPANEGRALAELVRPKPEKAEAREQARIKALCQLTGLEPTPERIKVLAGSVNIGIVPSGDDLVTTAKQVKKAIEAKALEQERARDMAAGKVGSLRDQLANLPERAAQEPAGEYADLVAAVRDANRTFDRTDASHQARLEQEAARAKLNAQLPVPDWNGVGKATAALDLVVDDGTPPIEVEDWRPYHTALAGIGTALETLKREVQLYRQTQEALNAPLVGATEQDVEAARVALRQAEDALDQTKEHDTLLGLKEEMESAVNEQMAAEKQATYYREIAGGVFSRLSDILGGAGLEDFVVDSGTLCVSIDGKVTPYSEARCSFGQLVFYALKVSFSAIDRAAKGEVLLPLPWDFWGSLDPQHKLEVADQALCVGVAIVTEDPSKGGPVRVEQWTPQK